MLFINGIKDERRGCQVHRILDVLEALEENGREPMIFSILTKNYSRNLGCHEYKPWSHYLKDIERIRQYREERRQKEEAESLAEEERKRLEAKREEMRQLRQEEARATLNLMAMDPNKETKMMQAFRNISPEAQAYLIAIANMISSKDLRLQSGSELSQDTLRWVRAIAITNLAFIETSSCDGQVIHADFSGRKAQEGG